MSSPPAQLVALLGLDPESYVPHLLHSPERTYVETNCYADILIEMLHARGDEPLAAMGRALRVDFEGDQWTFLKPPPEDLELLFGVDVHEMQPYRPLPEQIAAQLAAGRTLIVELDSWYLPDTAATSYRREHVKSSIVAEAIDPEAERLRCLASGAAQPRPAGAQWCCGSAISPLELGGASSITAGSPRRHTTTCAVRLPRWRYGRATRASAALTST
jgi:Domain of unknown function (DUF1839)